MESFLEITACVKEERPPAHMCGKCGSRAWKGFGTS